MYVVVQVVRFRIGIPKVLKYHLTPIGRVARRHHCPGSEANVRSSSNLALIFGLRMQCEKTRYM